MRSSGETWRSRRRAGVCALRDARLSIAAGGGICLALAAIAAWLVGGTWQDAARIGGYFVGGLVVSLLLLAGVAFVLLRAASNLCPADEAPGNRSSRDRESLSSLAASRNRYSPPLGIGVMFTLTVYLVQKSVLQEISRSAPPGMANVFFLDINPQQRDALTDMIRKHAGVERSPEIISTVSARLAAVNGVPIDQVDLQGGFARRYRMARAINTAGSKPEGTNVLRGVWWKGIPPHPQISVSEGAARILKLAPGSTLTWNVFGRTISSTVASIHRTDMQRLRANIEFIMSPGVLDGLPTIYYGGARVRTPAIASLQRDSYERFPTVTVVNIADILDRVQEVIDQISLVVRFISGFAILAGAIILASSVAGTRFRRVREIVILKTLGATRSQIARMLSIEFLILGAVAGLMGSLLATAFSAAVLKRLFDAPFHVALLPNVLSVGGTALIAAAAGWAASFRILGQKPLEVLRSD